MTEDKFKEILGEIEEEISIWFGDKQDLVTSIEAIIKRYVDVNKDFDQGGWRYEAEHANDWRKINQMGSL